MSVKEFALDDQLTITVIKRSSSRQIKLTLASDGQVKVSIPKWLPYMAAVDFAKTKKDWINSKRPAPKILEDSRAIGKSHHLVLSPGSTPTIKTRLKGTTAAVYFPRALSPSDPAVQLAAKRVIKRALTAQARTLLPQRVEQLAHQYDFSYQGLRIKSLKSRWGSCDTHQHITLNIYLMELPWPLIDYVILHELNHTLIMQHGPKFWQALGLKLPDYLELKKQLKAYATLV